MGKLKNLIKATLAIVQKKIMTQIPTMETKTMKSLTTEFNI